MVAPHHQSESTIAASVSSVEYMRSRAYTIWHSELSNRLSCAELIDHVADTLNVHRSQIAGWAQVHGWRVPARLTSNDIDDTELLGDAIEVHEGRTGIDCSTYLANLTVLDSQKRGLRDSACDPLQAWIDSLKDQHPRNRKQIATYFEAAGYNPAPQIDTNELTNLTKRYPLTAEQLSTLYNCETSPFCAYLKGRNIVLSDYAGMSPVSLGNLIMTDPGIAFIAIRQAQKLHQERAIPINKIARRLGLQWRDLWVMGCQYGVWRMPNEATVAEIEDNILNQRLAT